MANYLPVLLVSVNANVVTDDSSVVTQPRGQVDYLSHDWQEEDVAKSWRSMTRQKNEIANGARLENASWRTWWKQRNKLKTITPETLNWLKDSDVTWLYGPLHTATEWTPLPKPQPIATSVDDPTKSSDTVSRMDLSTGSRLKQKSILKHRSIGEMLACVFPSPPYTPADSDDEPDALKPSASPSSDHTPLPERVVLAHVKSDTHIARWGADRAFRKDSPPRIEPPNQSSKPDDPSTEIHPGGNEPGLTDYFALPQSRKRTRTSPDSDDQDRHPFHATDTVQSPDSKKKHISFNTFVEQCIAIDKPKDNGVFQSQPQPQHHTPWAGRKGSITSGDFLRPGALPKEWLDGSEDEGFGASPIWAQVESAIETDSEESSSISEDASDDDMGISMRPGKSQRSSSKASHSSSSSSATSSCASSSTDIRLKRRTSLRIPLATRHSQSSAHSSDSHHVTIAPIAPTMLKTHGETTLQPKPTIYWTENLGDDSQAYGDDGYSWGGVRKKPLQDDPDGTPVELVFVPPFGSGYDVEMQGASDDETPVASRILPSSQSMSQSDTITRARSSDNVHSIPQQSLHSSQGVPTVIRTPATMGLGDEAEDEYDGFEGPDMDIEFTGPTHSHRSRKGYPGNRHPDSEYSSTPTHHDRQSRETSHPIPVPEQLPSSSSTERLLSPPDRGRSIQLPSASDQLSRGRSSTRTSSSSLSTDRSSPLGSLSPDGVMSPGGASANGRKGERERQRSREKGKRSDREGERRERGRDKTSRSLSHSRSPSMPTSSSLDAAVVASTQLDGFVDVQMPSADTPTPTLETDKALPSSPILASPINVVTSSLRNQEAIYASVATPANSPIIGTHLPPYIKKGESTTTSKIRIGKTSSASRGSPNGGITKSKPVGNNATKRANGVVAVTTSTTPPSRSEPSSPITSTTGAEQRSSGHVRGGSTSSIGEGDGVVHKAVGLVSTAGVYLGFWNGNEKVQST